VSQNAAEDEPERSEDALGSAEADEAAGPAGGRRRKKRPFWIELPILLGIAVVLTLLITQFLAKVYMIPSGSMEATLHGCPGCTGDRILVDRITYDFTDPGPGDVIVFRGPPQWSDNEAPSSRSSNPIVRTLQSIGSVFGLAPPDEQDFVKRVIAVGGQTVQCCDSRNRVVVNGRALDEQPYLHWEAGTPHQQRAFAPVTVPPGQLWVMGDNRNDSCDSRCQGNGGLNGVVPVDNVIGKARIIVLPPSRWGGVSDYDPQADAQAVAEGPPRTAPAWQEGLPAGVGVAAAWPTLYLGRKLHAGVRRMRGRKRGVDT
jgi:signal peptidase I